MLVAPFGRLIAPRWESVFFDVVVKIRIAVVRLVPPPVRAADDEIFGCVE